MPFPGIYPTRWAIVVAYRNTRKRSEKLKRWGYFGKPSTLVARQLEWFVNNTFGNAWAWEVDKGGVIWNGMSPIPSVRRIRLHGWNQNLAKAYYPLCYEEGRPISEWILGDPMGVVRIRDGKKMYSTYSHMELSDVQILEYTKWRSTVKFG